MVRWACQGGGEDAKEKDEGMFTSLSGVRRLFAKEKKTNLLTDYGVRDHDARTGGGRFYF